MADVLRSALVVNRREKAPIFWSFVPPPLNLAVQLVVALPIGAAALLPAPQARAWAPTNTSAGTPLVLQAVETAPVVNALTHALNSRVAPLVNTSAGTPLTLLTPVAAALPPGSAQTASVNPAKAKRNWLPLNTSISVNPNLLAPVVYAPLPIGATLTTSITPNKGVKSWVPLNTSAAVNPNLFPPATPTPPSSANTYQLDLLASPNIPLASRAYDAIVSDRTSNVLRLYFNRINNAVNTVLSSQGGAYINAPYGAYYSAVSQTTASTTAANAVTFGATSFENDVSLVSNSRLTVATAGYYTVEYRLQLANANASAQDAYIWLAINGANVDATNVRYSVLGSGRLLASATYQLLLEVDDYVELYWCASSTDTSLEYTAAATSPTRPAIPSAAVVLNHVSRQA